MTLVDRTLSHMLSGKPTGGGIAWVGVLCRNDYGYGLSTSLGGNFDINNPRVVWDNMVVAHEIGHNFSSQHTHDYCGIGGISDPIDLCSNSSTCGSARGLPGINSLEGGVTANKPATIMSYCHGVSGGYDNMTFTFGKDHIYGIAAYRVPAQMLNHINSVAASNPTCFKLQVTSYIITVTSGSNGSITPSGNQSVNQGSSMSFTIAPASGYIIDAVTVDGVNVGAVSSYTFSNVQGNHSISASFKIQAITGPAGYTWCAKEGGSFTLPDISDVAYGANGIFVYQYGKSGTITFNNTTFGDPVPGVVKDGFYKKTSSNIALNKNATQSSTGYGGVPSRAVDGNTSGQWGVGSVTHTNSQSKAWWKVNLGSSHVVNKVTLWNRTDCCSNRLTNFHVDLLDANNIVIKTQNYPGTAGVKTEFNISASGVYAVRVQLNGSGFLSLAEVQVFGFR